MRRGTKRRLRGAQKRPFAFTRNSAQCRSNDSSEAHLKLFLNSLCRTVQSEVGHEDHDTPAG